MLTPFNAERREAPAGAAGLTTCVIHITTDDIYDARAVKEGPRATP